jgi:hypothetical protein
MFSYRAENLFTPLGHHRIYSPCYGLPSPGPKVKNPKKCHGPAAGFKEVSGVQCSGEMTAEAEKLGDFIGTIARNPGIRTLFLKDLSDDQIHDFKKNVRAVMIEKYGVQDVYKFKADANIVLGIK